MKVLSGALGIQKEWKIVALLHGPKSGSVRVWEVVVQLNAGKGE